ncbi:MAG: methyltransferase domain-containing protein [Chloroflexi bacterium]|nr:methyltransferase domain-containing protein [Chloroflexota bacterium]
MSLRFHELAEHHHRILNPFTEEQLLLLGNICQLHSDMQQLDLCCGKGEMLCRWAEASGLTGIGVDISPVFLKAAHRRAVELQVNNRLTFVEADAGKYPIPAGAFDIVSCIGATWIGGGLLGTLHKMRVGLRNRDSLLLVGEPYWIDEPPDEAYAAILDSDRAVYTTLAGTLERFESAGLELVEMVLADQHGWDRYVAKQWLTISDWLRAHPDDPEATEIRQRHERARQTYMTYTRRFFGWGVFVLRQP